MEVDEVAAGEPPLDGAGGGGESDEGQSALSPPTPIGRSCSNCAVPLVGPYCAVCGQNAASLRVSLREIIAHAASDIWSFDSRAFLTGAALIWPPGEITRQYLDGKRARFVPAFRLYLICSLLFFLVLSLTGTLRGSGQAAPNPQVVTEMAEARAELRAQAEGADGLERSILLRTERFLALQDGDEGVRAAIASALERNLPKVMFFLLPLFALILRVLYLRREWVYAEHLVFALHYHALTFALFAVALAAGRWVPLWIVFPLVVIYLPIAMRRVYRQGWLRTGVKAVLLGAVYFTICSMAIALLLAWTFFRV